MYDGWGQDEDGDDDYGGGGICDSVANALSEVVARALDDVTITDGGQDGDDHAFIVVLTDTEAVAVDIPRTCTRRAAATRGRSGRVSGSMPVTWFLIPFVAGILMTGSWTDGGLR